MTITDKWLIDLAQARKAKGAPKKGGSKLLKSLPPVDDAWDALLSETKRQADTYMAALEDPTAVVIETSADAIELRAADGRQLTLRVDRKQRRMFETFRSAAGAVAHRKPMIRFVPDPAGQMTFNFGGVSSAASSLLRKVIG